MTLDPPPAVGDRRPIATRDTAPARRISAWLVARRVSPNAISFVGMLAGALAGAALAATTQLPTAERALWLAAAALIQVRLACNLFDGMVAVASGHCDPVGELWNDLPDRISDSATLVGLGFAIGGDPRLGFAAALLAMLTAYVRVLGKATGAGSDFRGPMAKQQRMFVVTLVALYLGLAPLAWRPAWSLPTVALALINVGCVWTAARRLRTIARRLQNGER
jgi:phosphatidylglycerophosphate synthase